MDISSIGNLAAQIGVPVEPALPQPAGQDQRALIQAVSAVNSAQLFGQDNELTLGLAFKTRQAVIRIVNRETHQVVEQIPADQVLLLAERLKRG
jgi:uncharacterized FlaG/YvyC family protein